MTKSKMANRYSPEVHARAVRMVLEHQGSYETQAGAIAAIAPADRKSLLAAMRGEDRLHSSDPERMGQAGREGQRHAGWRDGRAT